MDDRRSLGKSKLVPYKRGEHPKKRHERRLRFNVLRAPQMADWCAANGIRIDITNGGHHWKFTSERAVAEWWPSSAKLVLNRRYRDGIHAHDYQQVIGVLAKHLTVSK